MTTLADKLHTALQSSTMATQPERYALQTALRRAQRYVLDTEASKLMADLAFAVIMKAESTPPYGHTKEAIAPDVSERLIALRHAAELPFSTTWIEFDNTARLMHARQLCSTNWNSDDLPVPRSGWLLERHPQMPAWHRSTYVADIHHRLVEEAKFPDQVFVMPIAWAWSITEQPEAETPWNDLTALGLINSPGFVGKAVGVSNYFDPHVRMVRSYLDHREANRPAFTKLLSDEFAGDLRYTWALLSTLRRVPFVIQEVQPGTRHTTESGKVLDYFVHRTVHLKLPTLRSQAAARQAVAGVIRRHRLHEVAAHDRVYHRGTDKEFVRRIEQHERGDERIGRVIRDATIVRHKKLAKAVETSPVSSAIESAVKR